LDTYMVVATFKPGTDKRVVHAVARDEMTRVEVLRAEGRLGSIHISMTRGKVFIEAFASDASSAEATVQTLPMAKRWDLDIYPTPQPAIPGA
jgi:hypothetical protein